MSIKDKFKKSVLKILFISPSMRLVIGSLIVFILFAGSVLVKTGKFGFDNFGIIQHIYNFLGLIKSNTPEVKEKEFNFVNIDSSIFISLNYLRNNNDEFYIDKNGKQLEKLGKWDHIEDFNDVTQLAKVIKDKYTYFLDTIGGSYKIATNISLLKDTTFKALDFSKNKLTPLDWQNIIKARQLEILILDSCDIQTLPEQIGLLTNLKNISLSNNKISKLPNSFSKLKKLSNINLNFNEFYEFPEQIASISNLEILFIGKNKLVSLPNSISNIRKLRMINVAYNELILLPESICNLVNLQVLNVSNNKLIQLPTKMGEMKKLKSLVLYNNYVIDLPSSLFKIENLKIMESKYNLNNYNRIATHDSIYNKFIQDKLNTLESRDQPNGE